MTAKPHPCAYCGQPLAASRLHVSAGATEGPTGQFHCGLGETCYLDAWSEWQGRVLVGASGTGRPAAPKPQTAILAQIWRPWRHRP